MEEHFKQLYHKEEDFLNEFGGAANAAVELLKGEWQPNYTANDTVRRNITYSFSRGELNDLTFDSAAIYHDDKGFPSAQIILKSSHRLVNVRVKTVDGKWVGEKIIDKFSE